MHLFWKVHGHYLFRSYLSACLFIFLTMLSRFSRVQLFATLWTATHQALLSMGFSRQEYWRGLPDPPPPGDLPDPGIEPTSLVFPALAGGFFTTVHLGNSYIHMYPLPLGFLPIQVTTRLKQSSLLQAWVSPFRAFNTWLEASCLRVD